MKEELEDVSPGWDDATPDEEPVSAELAHLINLIPLNVQKMGKGSLHTQIRSSLKGGNKPAQDRALGVRLRPGNST